MKKTLNLFSVMATLTTLTLLTGCGSDDTINDPTADNPITFSITANNESRSADFYCNNYKPNDIYVSALYNSGTAISPYMKNEHYKLINNVWSIDGFKRYWPTTGTLSFYATNVQSKNIGTDGGKVDVNMSTAPYGITYTPPTAADNQIDIIYSVAKNQTKPASGITALNFRHAVSLISFKAANKIPHAQITIESISINNVATAGSFAFPDADTKPNTEKHDGTGTAPTVESTGKWSELQYPAARNNSGRYFTTTPLSGTIVMKVNDETVKNLTDFTTSGTKETNYNKTLMLIPQTRAAWTPATAKSAFAQTAGAYLTIKCKIQNIALETATEPSATDIYIWDDGKGGTKELAIPLDVNWEAGKKYIYTITFNGKGSGGYDPDNGGEVLIPINLTATIHTADDGGSPSIDVVK